MLGMYLTSAINFLVADTPTISGSMDSIWTELGNAMMKVKDAIYNVLLQLITFKIINLQFTFLFHCLAIRKEHPFNKII
ncbi:hypothetical protein [Spiroplasma endosymbiont of Seladonia tumulorum]|uniref:hypothetical protein n=1 Tax=Spiroplasma endosymbiont of Seladonia tumulorum TaxID=3066321 RepID=UPI0030CC80A9